MSGFKGVERGDKIRFTVCEGTRIDEAGRVQPQFVERVALVDPLLIFDTHVVVRRGTCGTVVNATNFLRIEPRRRSK